MSATGSHTIWIALVAARLGVSIDAAREMTCREVARRMGGHYGH